LLVGGIVLAHVSGLHIKHALRHRRRIGWVWECVSAGARARPESVLLSYLY
jgi:hypothetical protein